MNFLKLGYCFNSNLKSSVLIFNLFYKQRCKSLQNITLRAELKKGYFKHLANRCMYINMKYIIHLKYQRLTSCISICWCVRIFKYLKEKQGKFRGGLQTTALETI